MENEGEGIVVQGKSKEDPKMVASKPAVVDLITVESQEIQNNGIGMSKDKGVQTPDKPNVVFPEEMKNGQNANREDGTEPVNENINETTESDNKDIGSDGEVDEKTEEEVSHDKSENMEEGVEDDTPDIDIVDNDEKEEEMKEKDAISE